MRVFLIEKQTKHKGWFPVPALQWFASERKAETHMRKHYLGLGTFRIAEYACISVPTTDGK